MIGYPVNLKLAGRLCVIIGAGPVGLRKLAALQGTGARLRLIDPAPPANLPAAAEVIPRAYRPGDLQGALLAIAATGDRQVNAAIAAEARATGVLVNVVDTPEEGDFTLPARLQRGALEVTVTTAGRAPALAVVLRDRLTATLGPEWALVVEIAAALRIRQLTPLRSSEYNQRVLHRLLEEGLPALLAAGDATAVDHLLTAVIGPGITLDSLGLCLPKGMP